MVFADDVGSKGQVRLLRQAAYQWVDNNNAFLALNECNVRDSWPRT